MWSFERFFTEVTRILSKKKIHIFFVNRLSEHRVYLDKEERLENFQGSVHGQNVKSSLGGGGRGVRQKAGYNSDRLRDCDSDEGTLKSQCFADVM